MTNLVEILLLAFVAFAVVATIGYVVNKYTRLPWMFTTVILGMTLAALGLFESVFASDNFAEKLKLDLVAYECEAEGIVKQYLDKTEFFTHIILRPKITVRNDDGAKTRRALEITRKYSLMAASVKSEVIIEPQIIIESAEASA